MSLAITRFPATITLDRTADGRFRAEFSGAVVEAATVDALFDALKLHVVGPDEDDPGGPEFDADVDYVLKKNAELYRRLAR